MPNKPTIAIWPTCKWVLLFIGLYLSAAFFLAKLEIQRQDHRWAIIRLLARQAGRQEQFAPIEKK